MMRTVTALLVVAALLAGTVAVERQLSERQPADPLGRRLLYLPSLEALKLMSLGNRGLMADALYLWSIQYYSQYEVGEEFLYLHSMLQLITDLDPLYRDPYEIGGMIMGLSRRDEEGNLVDDVIALYDKGLRNRPDDHRLAHFAAWDAYQNLDRPEDAIRFMEHACSVPGAPNVYRRVLGVWKDRNQHWTLEDSVRYWEDTVGDAENRVDLKAALSHLYDARARLDRQTLDPLLATYRLATGRCPVSWDDLVKAGLVPRAPSDSSGNVYGIDQARCTISPLKKIRIQ
jgi:tetratricopeptide (TPR) repeat protein